MPEFSAIAAAPDISFIDHKSIDDVKAEMVADFESYMEAAGEPVTLGKASVHRMLLYAAATQLYQTYQYVDRAGKQNLLKYAYSDFLDNLALLKGVTRIPAQAATTTLRFTLSAVREEATAIPAGTRAGGGSVFFATDEYAEIPVGSLYIEAPASCTVTGNAGNGFQVGEISKTVDPVAYVESVSNVTASEGGAEIESDSDLAERVYLAPSAYSTAGPEDSYKYHCKRYSPAIGDVEVSSEQEAGEVDIIFLMANGDTPGEETIEGLTEYLRDKNVRPMTDLVTVAAPEEVSYSITLTYYINKSDQQRAETIQAAVAAAVAEYQSWQRHIGRDINPDELVYRIKAAGAKRATVTAPVFTVVAKDKVAALSGTPTVTYGGLEDD